jgi:hypothetical protein
MQHEAKGTLMLLRRIALTLGVVLPGLLTLASAGERGPGPPIERRASDVALPVDTEALHRQYVALSAMPSVEVTYSALGPVRLVQGAIGIVLSSETRNLERGQEAPELLQKFKNVLLAMGSETLKVSRNERPPGQYRYLTTDLFINGIPVLYGGVSLKIDEATGLVEVLGANFVPDRGLPRQPNLSQADAAKRAAQYVVEHRGAKPGSVEASAVTLAYQGTNPGSTRGRLVWTVHARWPGPSGSFEDGDFKDGIFWIDAIDGEYVGSDAASR